jgi:diguanylate cyclase (GGDEF)-like protein/PAS domain S-box-containing protein
LVVLTGLDDESLAIRALQEGAQDYLIKGQIETRGLLRALRYAIERKAMKEALFVEKEHTQPTLNSIGDAVVCTDISGNINFFNLGAENMTGWSWQESAGRPMAEVFRILDATSRKTTRNPMEMAVGQNRTEHLPSNCVLLRRDGFEIPIEGSVSRIHDREGHATGAVVVFRDVSAAREMTRQMTHSAQHDVLTDLPNRLLLHDRLTHAIASVRRYRRKLAVLFLDLDSFEHINDSLGHAIGDKLLKTMGERLLAGVRKSDTVSRQGGDEFVVVLSSIGQSEDAALSVTKIISAISAPYSIDQHDLHVSVSVGISIYPDDGVEAEALIQNADNAMYKAKEKGINTYRFFKEEMNVQAVQRQSLEASLRHALERHEFELHYQPKINLQSGQTTGVEALIRWRHPERGLIPPGEFIPVAEGCGLIVPIGRWVLLEACRQARAWRDSGLPGVAVAVNVSAIEFLAKDFLSGVRAALIATGVEPRNLELELTETVLMRDAESTVDTLHALKAMGVQLAVDDFGTGYSSFSYLRRFPLDALKIDQSFVHEITGNPDDATIVSAMISIGKNLKQRVIAEGVETRKQLNFLQTQGCGEGQGYYFSRPAVAERFAKLLETGISETVLK